MNSLAYLGFSSIQEIEQMTLNEYQLRLEAYRLKEAKHYQDLAIQSFFNQMVQEPESKHSNKLKYKKIEDMYNFADEQAKIRHDFEGMPIKKSKNNQKDSMMKRWTAWEKRKERRKPNG